MRNLIDSLERGYSVEEFLDAFPSVTREQVISSLEAAHEVLSVRARSPMSNCLGNSRRTSSGTKPERFDSKVGSV